MTEQDYFRLHRTYLLCKIQLYLFLVVLTGAVAAGYDRAGGMAASRLAGRLTLLCLLLAALLGCTVGFRWKCPKCGAVLQIWDLGKQKEAGFAYYHCPCGQDIDLALISHPRQNGM